MSQGTYANHADTVTTDFVKEHCGQVYIDFVEFLKNKDVELDAFAMEYDEWAGRDLPAEWEDFEEALTGWYEALMAKFKEQTGLELQVRYHTKEDKGDEVDGAFWEVEGVYVLTPSGEKHKEQIERKFWTTWG